MRSVRGVSLMFHSTVGACGSTKPMLHSSPGAALSVGGIDEGTRCTTPAVSWLAKWNSEESLRT